jgi:hypothetical protein
VGLGIGHESGNGIFVTAKDKRLKDVKNQANSLKTKDLFSVFSEYFYYKVLLQYF